MKNYLTLVVAAFLALSCAADNETLTNNDKEKILEEQPIGPDAKSSAPKNNAIVKALQHPGTYNFAQADALYREYIPKSKSKKYYSTLRCLGFKLVMNNGLLLEGTPEQKRFYISEQMATDNNIPVLRDFYELLISSFDFTEEEELKNSAARFCGKNLAALEDAHLNDEVKKKSLRINIMVQQRNFTRWISVNYKKKDVTISKNAG